MGDETVTRAQLLDILKSLPPRVQGSYATQEGLIRLLQETLDKRAQAREARKLGLDRDPVVRDKINTYVEQKSEALEHQVSSLKEQLALLKKQAPDDILSAELFDVRTRAYSVPVTDAEAQQAYDSWRQDRLAADPKAQVPPLAVVRRELALEVVRNRVREDIRKSAGVTIYVEKLLAP